MANDIENEHSDDGSPTLKDRISAVGQVLIGELETIGGVLTADPTTQAEGEFNVEVGTIREEIEDDMIGAEKPAAGAPEREG